MQSTLYAASNSPPHFQYPWKPLKNHILTPLRTIPINPKPLILSTSLKTSFDYEFEEENLHTEDNRAVPVALPVVIRKSGSVSRYFWDENDLKLVSVDGAALSLSLLCFDFEDGFRKLWRLSTLAVRNFFLPREVSDNYLEYVKWKFLHRTFSSALQVLATQAMFRAIGIGYSHSLPSAAALNWVLKDGLGRLSRCIYTASLASAFDTNLKSAVHRSFAIADNLGEVSAKAQIQAVCFDNVGLVLAAILNIVFKNSPRLQSGLPFLVYPIFSAIDLFGIYQGLNNVHLQTLTKDRLEIIIDMWIQFGCVPGPAEVSKKEGINFLWSQGRELWPVRIGCLNSKGQMPRLSMMMMRSLSDDDFYFVCLEMICRGLRRPRQQGILLCLREGASTEDVIMGLLQACYIRKILLLSKSKWDNILEAYENSGSCLRDWFKLMEDCKQRAKVDLDMLKEQLIGMGWICKNILLTTEEQVRYSFVDD